MFRKYFNTQLLLLALVSSCLQAVDSLEKSKQHYELVLKTAVVPSTNVFRSDNNTTLQGERFLHEMLGVGMIIMSVSMFYKLSTGRWEL